MPEKAHGTLYGYKHYGCRCDACKAAEAAYYKKSRKARFDAG
jgi:hypothetical protein